MQYFPPYKTLFIAYNPDYTTSEQVRTECQKHGFIKYRNALSGPYLFVLFATIFKAFQAYNSMKNMAIEDGYITVGWAKNNDKKNTNNNRGSHRRFYRGPHKLYRNVSNGGLYNRELYNREPYNRGLFNREPYNRESYNRNSYDRESYNREPYNSEYYRSILLILCIMISLYHIDMNNNIATEMIA